MRIAAKIIYNRKDGKRNAEIKGFRNTIEAFRYALRRAAEKDATSIKIKYL